MTSVFTSPLLCSQLRANCLQSSDVLPRKNSDQSTNAFFSFQGFTRLSDIGARPYAKDHPVNGRVKWPHQSICPACKFIATFNRKQAINFEEASSFVAATVLSPERPSRRPITQLSEGSVSANYTRSAKEPKEQSFHGHCSVVRFKSLPLNLPHSLMEISPPRPPLHQICHIHQSVSVSNQTPVNLALPGHKYRPPIHGHRQPAHCHTCGF